MVRTFTNLRSASLLAALLVGACAAEANAAGFVGYRNDTNQVVVVQSSITVNGVVRRGKAQMLSPGEIAVDNLVVVGPRRITVYDPKKPTSPLFQDDVTLTADALLSIQPDMPATPVKNPPPLTKVKLVAIRTPAPPGPVSPSMPAKPKKP
ncbi:MAG: hypothetical protein ACJ8F7_05090 [Gemmataceae bacterium]